MIKKLNMSSPDLVKQNIEKVAALFPNCVTETTNGLAIDFDLLKQELNHDIVDGTKERYRLEWPGKREAIVTANLPTTKTLRPIREDSVDFDNTENIYIEGDNLEVLKLLQESYLDKIKMIYIDPPYNTGNDFVYKDNFTQDSDEFKEESGLVDETNNRLIANPETSGRYHSDWLSMIYPRLKLARNLLADDGVIFISIDDHEGFNLKRLCDDIYGIDNYVCTYAWQKRYSAPPDTKDVGFMHESILMYKKSDKFEIGLLPFTEEQLDRYKNPDNDPRGPWKAADYTSRYTSVERPTLYYEIINSNTMEKILPKKTRVWAYSKESHKINIDEKRIWWGKDGQNSVPALKNFVSEIKQGRMPTSLLLHGEVGHTDEATKELRLLIPEVKFTPKPTRLIETLMKISNVKDHDVVLDFFSGSSSTAHAVIKLNAKDGGNRKFIQVQLPEETDLKSEAYKAGYKNICEIGKERIRRAANKIKEETKVDIDYGFRVYRLDDSNMQEVYYKPQDYQQVQLDVFADNVKPDRTADDLLAQVMLDWGLQLSLKIETLSIKGKQVFKVAENSLLACFDSDIDEAFAKEIANYKALRIVFKDSSFKDDTAKENVKQLLKQLSPETEMKVI